WTYMTAADARGIWGHLEVELAPVNIGRQVGWVLRDDVPALKRAKLESTVVRLLPNFDSFLLGVKDKSHLVDAAHYKRVYRPQGWLSPVVLIDGRVAGVWSYSRKRRRLEIRVEAFQTLRSADRAAIRDEAEELRRFLDAPEVAVAFARA
ncbi:MAG: winged helix DNA-binding domain-containing protein, partial [Methanobacteriota archaeon]